MRIAGVEVGGGVGVVIGERCGGSSVAARRTAPSCLHLRNRGLVLRPVRGAVFPSRGATLW